MAVLIRNRTASPYTLPSPLKGALAPGQGIVLNSTEAAVRAAIGNVPALQIYEVRQTGNFDSGYAGQLAEPNIETSEIVDGAVTTAKLAASAVSGAKLAAGVFKSNVVPGQDETSDTTIPVTGMAVGDELVSVFVNTAGVLSERALTDFNVIAGNIDVVANAANNATNQYVITWIDKT